TGKYLDFPALGMPTPSPFSLFGVAGLIEIIGGLLVLVGFYTRVAAFIMSGEMAVAYFTAHLPHGFFPILNEGESALLFCFVFLYLVFAGPGAWSIDEARTSARLALKHAEGEATARWVWRIDPACPPGSPRDLEVDGYRFEDVVRGDRRENEAGDAADDPGTAFADDTIDLLRPDEHRQRDQEHDAEHAGGDRLLADGKAVIVGEEHHCQHRSRTGNGWYADRK